VGQWLEVSKCFPVCQHRGNHEISGYEQGASKTIGRKNHQPIDKLGRYRTERETEHPFGRPAHRKLGDRCIQRFSFEMRCVYRPDAERDHTRFCHRDVFCPLA
jgi:hypothetical protein